MDQQNKDIDHIFICGGGFHAFWYGLGCGRALLKGEQNNEYKQLVLSGYSAGALAAVLLSFPLITNRRILQVTEGLVSECRIGHLDKVIRNMLLALLPEDAAQQLSVKGINRNRATHRANQTKLQIILCLCSDGFRPIVVTEWQSKAQLIDCVVASCFIPGITSFRWTDPVYHCMDGTFARGGKEGLILSAMAAADIRADTDKITKHVIEYRGTFGFEQFRPITKVDALYLYWQGCAHDQNNCI